MQTRPLGVTIAAILLAIGGVLQILTGAEALGFAKLGLGAVAEAAGVSGWASVIGGALSLIVSAGLFTLAGWAWLLAVVVMVVRILVDLWAILTHGATSTVGYAAIANLVVSAAILWYFQRGNVKAAFGR